MLLTLKKFDGAYCFWFVHPFFFCVLPSVCHVNRRSYMSAQLLLNFLLDKLGKSDKMQGLPSILSLFRNKFNKFNNTGAQMLDSFYYMTLKLHKNHIF